MLDFNKETQIDFLDWISEGGIEIHELKQWQISGIRDKMEKYSDLPADFADATLLQTAEERDLDFIITLDKDFQVYRNQKGSPLTNLL
jgi:predicted nucleic acid-binding protein